MTGPEKACELLKALRGAWLTKAQIGRLLGIKIESAGEWVDEWQRQGVLDVRLGDKPKRGPQPAEYTLSPWWIGGGR